MNEHGHTAARLTIGLSIDHVLLGAGVGLG